MEKCAIYLLPTDNRRCKGNKKSQISERRSRMLHEGGKETDALIRRDFFSYP